MPQARANEVVAEIDDPKRGRVVQMGIPFRFSKTPGAIKCTGAGAGRAYARDRHFAQPAGEPARIAKAIKPRPLRHPLFDTVLIDFGHYAAGPFGPMLLSDLGAKVIKVETIEGEGMRQPFQPFFISQRGKKTIAVDLKSEAGREIAYKLVAECRHRTSQSAARRRRAAQDRLRVAEQDQARPDLHPRPGLWHARAAMP